MELKLFGYSVVNTNPRHVEQSRVQKPLGGKKIVSKIVGWIQALTKFESMSDEEIQEQLLIWDPAVGGAIDRESTLIAECYKGVYLKDPDLITSSKEAAMLKDAIKIAEDMKCENLFEMYGEILTVFGDLYIDNRDPLTQKILPNRFITIIEDMKQLNWIQAGLLMTQENYLVFNEGLSGYFVIPKDKFLHLKYKDTPIFATDKLGRWTYGMYSVSPVQRAVLSVWQMRINTITDILYRWRIIPREVHSIDSTLFALDQYMPTATADRLSQAQTSANKFIAEYNAIIADQSPDQGYTVLDTVDIKIIESKTNGYMRTNELQNQLSGNIWTALNMPKSVVTGEEAGSYASELVISNYVSGKALQIAKKVKPVVLNNLKARLLIKDGSYPVDEIDIKLELSMAATRLETFREAAIMGSFKNAFTTTEIRAHLGYAPLTDAQKKDIVEVNEQSMRAQLDKANNIADGSKNPETPHSANQHNKGKGTNNDAQ